MSCYLNTGLTLCYNETGESIDCRGTGQDAEFRPGKAWPVPRFEKQGAAALDRLTGLIWSVDANPAEFPLSWSEALSFIRQMNRDTYQGRSDWRLPNRREMRSLISYQHRKPALPENHPFKNIFLNWCWTSTTAAVNPAYAWYVHLEGGRMFYGHKRQSYLVWPVSGAGDLLPVTGQERSYDQKGNVIAASGSGQDGERIFGRLWPEPRFSIRGEAVLDNLTNLWWRREACLSEKDVNWVEAFDLVTRFNQKQGGHTWRLPTINELESLVDARCHHPALPIDHPFTKVRQIYLSSTTSGFEPDWCMLLHLHKGAVGVGQKKQKSFSVWPVRHSDENPGW